mgnify:CR=1 FL=1
MGLKILGTGSALPSHMVTNEKLTKMVDTSDEWIASRTGIRQRHISTGETTTELCVRAARRALENAGLQGEEKASGRPITYTDLYEWGLSGTADCADRRREFLGFLGLPPRLSKKALCQVLNTIYTYEELSQALARWQKNREANTNFSSAEGQK